MGGKNVKSLWDIIRSAGDSSLEVEAARCFLAS